jgi:hypothetical protein
MKKERAVKGSDELRREHDLSRLKCRARGKHYHRATAGMNLVLNPQAPTALRVRQEPRIRSGLALMRIRQLPVTEQHDCTQLLKAVWENQRWTLESWPCATDALARRSLIVIVGRPIMAAAGF